MIKTEKEDLNGWYVVKPWKLIEKEFILEEDEDGDIHIKTSYGYCWFSFEMEKLMPKGRVIEVIKGKWGEFSIISEILLGPYFEYGEKIEVSDDGEDWEIGTFQHYEPGRVFSVRCKHYRDNVQQYTIHKYARKLQKPQTEYLLTKKEGDKMKHVALTDEQKNILGIGEKT